MTIISYVPQQLATSNNIMSSIRKGWSIPILQLASVHVADVHLPISSLELIKVKV